MKNKRNFIGLFALLGGIVSISVLSNGLALKNAKPSLAVSGYSGETDNRTAITLNITKPTDRQPTGTTDTDLGTNFTLSDGTTTIKLTTVVGITSYTAWSDTYGFGMRDNTTSTVTNIRYFEVTSSYLINQIDFTVACSSNAGYFGTALETSSSLVPFTGTGLTQSNVTQENVKLYSKSLSSNTVTTIQTFNGDADNDGVADFSEGKARFYFYRSGKSSTVSYLKSITIYCSLSASHDVEIKNTNNVLLGTQKAYEGTDFEPNEASLGVGTLFKSALFYDDIECETLYVKRDITTDGVVIYAVLNDYENYVVSIYYGSDLVSSETVNENETYTPDDTWLDVYATSYNDPAATYYTDLEKTNVYSATKINANTSLYASISESGHYWIYVGFTGSVSIGTVKCHIWQSSPAKDRAAWASDPTMTALSGATRSYYIEIGNDANDATYNWNKIIFRNGSYQTGDSSLETGKKSQTFSWAGNGTATVVTSSTTTKSSDVAMLTGDTLPSVTNIPVTKTSTTYGFYHTELKKGVVTQVKSTGLTDAQ